MFERLLLVWLCLLSGLAYFWTSFAPPACDPFLATKSYLNYFFCATMFALGALLPREEIRMVFRRWPTVIGGTATQYIVMPFLGWSMAWAFGLDRAAQIGVIIVGCVPGAMASNVLTMVSRGNVSYSVSITTSSTVLSPLVVPLALWLTLGKLIEFPTAKVAWELSWTVAIPVALGHLSSRVSDAWRKTAERIGPHLANCSILWIISVVVAVNRDKMTQLDGRMLGALVAVNLLGYVGGWLGAYWMGLPASMRRALTLEVGMQNAGLGTIIAMSVFPDLPQAAVPPAIYTFGCVLTGTILARIWAGIKTEAAAPQAEEIDVDRAEEAIADG
jgi:BASS family bile acid:Na+ symporter